MRGTAQRMRGQQKRHHRYGQRTTRQTLHGHRSRVHKSGVRCTGVYVIQDLYGCIVAFLGILKNRAGEMIPGRFFSLRYFAPLDPM